MYSFPNFEPVCCSMSSSNCSFLTCTQVSQETGKVVWNSHLFQNFPVCCDPQKGFSIVNEADVFLEFSCFFYDPMDVCNLISSSSAFSQSSLCIWKFSVHILLKPAAATAKSLQLCPTVCDPTDGSPPGSSVPEILQARTLEWVAISFSNA